MKNVRLGIIGTGSMGAGHATYLKENKINNCVLSAICDVVKPTNEIFNNIKYYNDYKELILSGDVDAVLIATPHYAHTEIGVFALENNIHTLVEKPISVHKNDCLKLINAHKNKDVIFAAMFNQRTKPEFIKIKELISTLGNLQRVNYIITDWYRTEAYYKSGTWRATWGGEGGGILLNQCPHQLDILQWLVGMPTSILATCDFGKFHNIEVEDEVSAIMTFKNGASGIFTANTGEYPGTNRLEIIGDLGKLVYEDNKLTLSRNCVSATEFSKTTKEAWSTPTCETIKIEMPKQEFLNQHATITQNFVNAILFNEDLIAKSEEGINSVELANSMILSEIKKEKISLPINGDEYEEALNQLKDKEI